MSSGVALKKMKLVVLRGMGLVVSWTLALPPQPAIAEELASAGEGVKIAGDNSSEAAIDTVVVVRELQHDQTTLTLELDNQSQKPTICQLVAAVDLEVLASTIRDDVRTMTIRANRNFTITIDFSAEMQEAGADGDRIKGLNLEATTLSCQALDENRDLWVNDNGADKLSQVFDRYRIRETRSTDPLQKTYAVDLQNGADYPRLCDAYFSLTYQTKDSALSIKDSQHFKRILLKPATAATLEMSSSVVERWPDAKLDEASFSMSCLRWEGVSLPDPQKNPLQRPQRLPHEICDPVRSKACVPMNEDVAS